jgi:hypothetical protein
MKLIPSVYSAVSYGEGIAVSDSDEDNQAGVVTLLHNIIIAGDEQTRAWFAQYLKCMQQKVRTVCTQVYYLDSFCGYTIVYLLTHNYITLRG